MSITADTLLDRLHLKRQLTRWRVLAVVAAAFALFVLIGKEETFSPSMHGDRIARVSVEGVIMDDIRYDRLFQQLAENDAVKAAIIRINSSGGSIVGGQQLYLNIRSLAEKKPVVISMRSTATSAAYMAALGGHYIFAMEGTITGSIGVILQMAEFTEMADKLGIKPITVKSGPYKATPSPLEKFSDSERKLVQQAVDDSNRFFVSLVAQRRSLSPEEAKKLADGRIFTGTQAIEQKLVDAIGTESDARDWLIKEKGISEALETVDAELEEELPGWMEQFGSAIYQSFFSRGAIGLDGLVAIWHPNAL